MPDCPHCQQPHHVSFIRTWSSGKAFPAQCRACGQKFHPDVFLGFITGEVMMLPFTLIASLHWAGLVIGVFGLAVTVLVISAMVPLVKS
jgi:hypothetical protein